MAQNVGVVYSYPTMAPLRINIVVIFVIIICWTLFNLDLSYHINNVTKIPMDRINCIMYDAGIIDCIRSNTNVADNPSTDCMTNEEITEGNWIFSKSILNTQNKTKLLYNLTYFDRPNHRIQYQVSNLWKPQNCILQDFGTDDALINKLRNRKIVFFGDSLSRLIYKSFYLLIMDNLKIPTTQKVYWRELAH